MCYVTYPTKVFSIVYDVFEQFKKHIIFEMYFGVFGVFCTINCYFEYRNRILCI